MEPQRDWDPAQYLKYANERTQPSIDLVAKIKVDFVPASILDIGCGPGNSSQVLRQRWPEAVLTGIDSSASMIAKAKEGFPGGNWIVANASTFSPDTKYDVVFSNATIQWIPDHERLFNNICKLVNKQGVLAICVPRFDEMPLSNIIQKVANDETWREPTRGCAELFTHHDYRYYYELIRRDYRSLEFWQTDYIHVLPSQESIIEWIRSTGLAPYLDRLGNDDKLQFEKEVLAGISHDYPVKSDGKVLFPFKRLFFTGYK